MADTFHMSQAFLRRQRLLWPGMLLLVSLIVAARSFTGSDLGASSIVAVLVVGMAAFVAWRGYRRIANFAAHHALILEADAVVLRDGPTERRIPYQGIERLTIGSPLLGAAYFKIKCVDLPEDTFYGYERIDSLVETIAMKLPSDRVRRR